MAIHGQAPSAMTRRAGRWALLAVAGLAVALFYWLDLGRWLPLGAVQAHRDALLAWTQGHYAAAAAVFIVLYCAQTALSLPGATVFTLVGGFLFGTLPGALFVNLGAAPGGPPPRLPAGGRFPLRPAAGPPFRHPRRAPGPPARFLSPRLSNRGGGARGRA